MGSPRRHLASRDIGVEDPLKHVPIHYLRTLVYRGGMCHPCLTYANPRSLKVSASATFLRPPHYYHCWRRPSINHLVYHNLWNRLVASVVETGFSRTAGRLQ